MVARRSSAGAAARRIADTATAVASEPKAGPFASAARALHAIGLWVLPLVAEGDGKSPHVQDFTRWQRRPGRAALAKWEECWPDANIGILTGNLVVVVDVDDATLIPKMLERFGPTPASSHPFGRWPPLLSSERRGLHNVTSRTACRYQGSRWLCSCAAFYPPEW